MRRIEMMQKEELGVSGGSYMDRYDQEKSREGKKKKGREERVRVEKRRKEMRRVERGEVKMRI